MTQALDPESRNALIAYRISRAEDTLADAVMAANNGSYNSAMNRLYYACFYAVLALLIKHGIEAKTHEGVRRMFGLHFIANKKIENVYNIYYTQIYQARIQGDYDDFMMFDAETAEAYIENGTKLLSRIKIAVLAAPHP